MKNEIEGRVKITAEFVKAKKAKSKRMKGGRHYYFRGANQELFELLESDGFFNYHITNKSKQIVTRAQVVHWISCGWKAYINGAVAEHGLHEVHHQNGRCWMDYPSNLIMIPVWLHRLCTKAQRRVGAFVSWKSMQKDNQDLEMWNARGLRVKNKYRFICSVISSCVARSVGKDTLMLIRSNWITQNIERVIAGFTNLIKDNMRFVFPGREDELNLQRASELF